MKTKEEIDLLLQKELETIIKIREICKAEAVNHLKSHIKGQKKALDIIERVFEGELEFLGDSPMEYYRIYLEDEI